MSFITPATVQSIANSLDLTRMSDDAAKALAPDVEYRLRGVIEEALKCMRHSRRTVLTPHDVALALRIQNIEPLYGFSGADVMRFRRVAGHGELYYLENKTLTVDQLLQQGLPPCPKDVALMPHWLAVDGKQPAIPQNTPLEKPDIPAGIATAAAITAAATGGGGGGRGDKKRGREATTVLAERPAKAPHATGPAVPGATLKLPVRHVVTEELQLYFKKVMAILESVSTGSAPGGVGGVGVGGGHGVRQTGAVHRKLMSSVLASLAQDPGIQPLIPYFVSTIVQGLHTPPTPTRAQLLLLLMASLASNPHVQLELYLHQIMPALLSCAMRGTVTGGGGGGGVVKEYPDDHIHALLREHAASVASLLCRHYAQPEYNLTARTAAFALKTLLDPTRSLPTQYGCIATIWALGTSTVQVVLLPHVVSLLRRYDAVCGEETTGVGGSAAAMACRGLLVQGVAMALATFWDDRALHVAGLITTRRCVRVPLPPLAPLSPTRGAVNGNVDHGAPGAPGAPGPSSKAGGEGGKSSTKAATAHKGGGTKQPKKNKGENEERSSLGEDHEEEDEEDGQGAAEDADDAAAANTNTTDAAPLRTRGDDDAVGQRFVEVYEDMGEALLALIPCREAHAAVFL